MQRVRLKATSIVQKKAHTRIICRYHSTSPPLLDMATRRDLIPSTSERGFVLTTTSLENSYGGDPSFQRILAWYLPQDTLRAVEPKLKKFAAEAVSDRIHEFVANAETQQPYIKKYNVWGQRYSADRLVTGHGWKELGKWGARNGVIALGYDEEFGPFRRIVQHAFNYVYSASSAVYSCPVSMTSGAARLLSYQLPGLPLDHPFHEIYKRITARENSWTSSQWMTERPGGSDVQNSETVAVYSPLPSKTGEHGKLEEGDYLISGFKYFASATDCNIALMLAKTKSGVLSLFIAPTRKTAVGPDGRATEVSNGIRFHRLKNKMGTKELPTAELELKDLRAHLVGPLDRGIPTIALLLNVTRTHNFITALSCWRRAMFIAKAFAKARTTIDQPLWTFPMHLRLLSTMEVKHRGALQLCFFTTALLSFVDNGFPPSTSDMPWGLAPLPQPGDEARVILRLLTATVKAVVCKVACTSLQECQEAMGGVGYMDEADEPEFNISRLYRDTAANMTWEGTTNVLSSEIVRHLLNGGNLEVVDKWLARTIMSVEDSDMRECLSHAWGTLKHKLIDNGMSLSAILASGRQIMFSVAWVKGGALLAHDAQRDKDPIACEIARRWILDAEGGVGEFVFPDVVFMHSRPRVQKERERADWDCRLVWGVGLPEDHAMGYRRKPGSAKL